MTRDAGEERATQGAARLGVRREEDAREHRGWGQKRERSAQGDKQGLGSRQLEITTAGRRDFSFQELSNAGDKAKGPCPMEKKHLRDGKTSGDRIRKKLSGGDLGRYFPIFYFFSLFFFTEITENFLFLFFFLQKS
jgi:hypothetical protein